MQKAMQYKFNNIIGVIKGCKSKDRQHNGQKKKDKNNDLQNITQKTKYVAS